MSNVVPLRRCSGCGHSAEVRTITHESSGEAVTVFLCDKCLDRTMEFLVKMRPIFEKMIELDVPREVANEAMTFLLTRMDEHDHV